MTAMTHSRDLFEAPKVEIGRFANGAANDDAVARTSVLPQKLYVRFFTGPLTSSLIGMPDKRDQVFKAAKIECFEIPQRLLSEIGKVMPDDAFAFEIVTQTKPANIFARQAAHLPQGQVYFIGTLNQRNGHDMVLRTANDTLIAIQDGDVVLNPTLQQIYPLKNRPAEQVSVPYLARDFDPSTP